MKRLLVGGLPRIYQFAHCFCADERGQLHNSEFAMLEWHRAFAGIDDIVSDTEEIVAQLAVALRGEPSLQWKGRGVSVEPPFETVSVL